MKVPRIKKIEGDKWRITGMKDAGMNQNDINRVLNISQNIMGSLLRNIERLTQRAHNVDQR